jgi:flagellar basal body-associated protein FliL
MGNVKETVETTEETKATVETKEEDAKKSGELLHNIVLIAIGAVIGVVLSYAVFVSAFKESAETFTSSASSTAVETTTTTESEADTDEAESDDAEEVEAVTESVEDAE